jgi:hypothetical protein
MNASIRRTISTAGGVALLLVLMPPLVGTGTALAQCTARTQTGVGSNIVALAQRCGTTAGDLRRANPGRNLNNPGRPQRAWRAHRRELRQPQQFRRAAATRYPRYQSAARHDADAVSNVATWRKSAPLFHPARRYAERARQPLRCSAPADRRRQSGCRSGTACRRPAGHDPPNPRWTETQPASPRPFMR